MPGLAKRILLIYFLFLLTTVNVNAVDRIVPITDPMPFSGIEEQANLRSDEISVEEIRSEKLLKAQQAQTDLLRKKITIAKEEPKGVSPVFIEIPAIGIQAEIEKVGQTEDGKMEVPESIYKAGWYESGVKPGDRGNAVMAGHVDGLSGPGIFYNLEKLEKGDTIYVMDKDGAKLEFKVTGKKAYSPDKAPLMKIFGFDGDANLNLITCTGRFNTKTGHYDERLVVYTKLTDHPSN